MKQLSLGLGLLAQEVSGGVIASSEASPFLIRPNLDKDGVHIGFEVHVGTMKKKNNEHGGHVKWKLIKVTDTLQDAILATKGET